MGPLVTAVGTAVSGSKLLHSSSMALPLELPCSCMGNRAPEVRLALHRRAAGCLPAHLAKHRLADGGEVPLLDQRLSALHDPLHHDICRGSDTQMC